MMDCDGDTHIDDHHMVEDISIRLSQAFAKAVDDKSGIVRYGYSYVPLDDALSRVVINFSSRPSFDFKWDFTRGNIGRFDTQLFWEFIYGFLNHVVIDYGMVICTALMERYKMLRLIAIF
jgi:imidazoleglycerol-phosphate dehydratase